MSGVRTITTISHTHTHTPRDVVGRLRIRGRRPLAALHQPRLCDAAARPCGPQCRLDSARRRHGERGAGAARLRRLLAAVALPADARKRGGEPVTGGFNQDIVAVIMCVGIRTQHLVLIVLLFVSEFIVGGIFFVFRNGFARIVLAELRDGMRHHYQPTDRGSLAAPSVASLWDAMQMNVSGRNEVIS